jgi:mannitol/fructose-specific phosphotransferase system IIA component (Ntr-type)
MSDLRMNLAHFTESQSLIPRLLHKHREIAIMALSGRLETAGRIEDSGAFADAVLEHEGLASAVLGNVAFPLARGRTARELSFALGLAQDPFRWGVGSGAPMVDTVVLFAVPESEEERYLSLLFGFSSFFKDESAIAALRRCMQPEEMLAVLRNARVARK